MKKIHYVFFVISLLLFPVTHAKAQVNIGIGIGLPNLRIGINLPMFPELTPVPGYPVYYAPQVDGNYFFYDGMYWVYQDDNWYASSWYNGPWGFVEPEAVPSFVLRIPVRYYRQPPVYFRGWQSNAAPRWGQHWGRDWEHRRSGWDRWNRNSAPARAPRPSYQRQYAGDRYPHAEQQHALHNQSYRYQPRDKVVRQHLQQQVGQRPPAPVQRGRQETPHMKGDGQNEPQRSMQHQQGAPPNPSSQQPQQRGLESGGKGQQAPRMQGHEQRPQERGEPQEPNRGRGEVREKDDDRGRGRDK